jgi:hypothetical protein
MPPAFDAPTHLAGSGTTTGLGTAGTAGTATGPMASRLPYAFERQHARAVAGLGIPGHSSERITFTAPCPVCGNDAEWLQVRQDTAVKGTVHCPCPDL